MTLVAGARRAAPWWTGETERSPERFPEVHRGPSLASAGHPRASPSATAGGARCRLKMELGAAAVKRAAGGEKVLAHRGPRLTRQRPASPLSTLSWPRSSRITKAGGRAGSVSHSSCRRGARRRSSARWPGTYELGSKENTGEPPGGGGGNMTHHYKYSRWVRFLGRIEEARAASSCATTEKTANPQFLGN